MLWLIFTLDDFQLDDQERNKIIAEIGEGGVHNLDEEDLDKIRIQVSAGTMSK